jgi:hypothetical protein
LLIATSPFDSTFTTAKSPVNPDSNRRLLCFARTETSSQPLGYRKLPLTISRKAPVPLRAEHPAVSFQEIWVNMQENDKTPEITCTGVPDDFLLSPIPQVRWWKAAVNSETIAESVDQTGLCQAVKSCLFVLLSI